VSIFVSLDVALDFFGSDKDGIWLLNFNLNNFFVMALFFFFFVYLLHFFNKLVEVEPFSRLWIKGHIIP